MAGRSGVEEALPVRAESRAIAGKHAPRHLRDCAIRIKAIERRILGCFRHVDEACPETAPAIGAAIVETQVGLVCQDLFAEWFGLGIAPGVAAKAYLHRQHPAGVTHEGEASNGRSRRPACVMTANRLAAMQFIAGNV